MTFPARAVETSTSASDSPPLTSWYTEGTSDGIGDRLLMFDNSGTPSLELLRFRQALAEADGFEDALRQRVAVVATFKHPAFPQVHSVETLENGSLALISTFTGGKRLGEMFHSARTRGGIHPAFAAWLIREITMSLADFQRQGIGIAHGALNPERIVLTDEGRLVITEHALGSALDSLQRPPARLWKDFLLVAPSDDTGRCRLDRRTDVIQLGYIMLSALLGRRIGPAAPAPALTELINEFVSIGSNRAPRLVPPLAHWLERALQLGAQPFASAGEARDALSELRVLGGPQPLALKSRPLVTDMRQPNQTRPGMEPILTPPHVTETTITAATSAVEAFVSESDPQAIARAVRGSAARTDAEETGTRRGIAARGVSSETLTWTIVAVLAIVAIVEGVVIARIRSRPAAPAIVGVPVVLGGAQAGDPVIVDGRQVGVTPLSMTINPGMRSIGIEARALVTATPPPAAPPAAESAGTGDAAAIAAARDRRGGLRVVSPVEVQVLEGEHVLGASVDGPMVTTAGRHELDFINTAIGYRSRQTVDIKAGQILRFTVTPPDGRISANAVPWAQVSIDGKAVGETPFANLPLPAGEHQITFKHPQLGEQTQRVVVKSGTLTRVSTSFGK